MADTGKSEWIVEALKLHERSLIRYASWILNDIECAREVVQETFLRLCKEEPAQVSGHLAQWLFTVCRNRTHDVQRKEGRMKRFEEGQVEQLAAPESRPGRALEQNEQHAAVLRLIGQLPRNQQEVVRLKFQNGFSYQEISRITSLSVTNVGFILHTAIKRLRQDIAAQPE
jgi:RNA polymerase sigma-70 factor (ECF subfamily)